MRALVVDDSRVARLVASRILKELGFDVFEAVDGRAALGCLTTSEPFDLALVDWNMPNMNGIDLLAALREDAAARPRQIVMVTTETEPAQIERALSLGANEYVMKPYTKDILKDKLSLLGFTEVAAAVTS